MFRLAVLFLSLFVVCCSVSVVPAGSLPEGCGFVKVTNIWFHGDKDFTQAERDEVEKAIVEWFTFSGGTVVFRVTWDLDAHSVTKLPAGEWYLVRLKSDDELTKGWDSEDAKILGRVSDIGAQWGAMWLVADRAEGADLRAIVMHEMGHVVGLRHLNQSGQIMSAAHTWGVTAFTPVDKRACVEACYCLP